MPRSGSFILGIKSKSQGLKPDDGQKTCPKHVEFYSKNKFEKIVHLVGFIIIIIIIIIIVIILYRLTPVLPDFRARELC